MNIKKIYKHPNLTICHIIGDDGLESRVGVPFESENELELISYIEENYHTTREAIEANSAPTQEYLDTEYQRKRLPEYPSIGDQLDALWKGGDAAAEMLAKVQAVKAKYPKP